MRRSFIGFGWALLGLAACGSVKEEQEATAGGSLAAQRAAEPAAESGWIAQLRGQFHLADGADFLPRSSLSVRRLGGVFSAVGAALPGAVRGELPGRADGELTLRDPASKVGVRVALEGASPVEGQADGGFVVYRAAHESGADVLLRPLAEGAEDYLHFTQKPAREAVRYRLSLEGAAGLRLVADTLEVLDAGGAPRLRMAPPRGVDAAGKAIAARVKVEGCAVDTSPAAPWGRPVTAPGAGWCSVEVSWGGAAYPMLLDPLWSNTGSMAQTRSNYTASTLNNGKILVAGGGNSNGTELYDPATGTWASTGALITNRSSHTGTTLADGRVFVAGSGTSTELYDPATGIWTSKAAMSVSRLEHTATLLQDGTVYVVGGRANSSTYHSSAARYNPVTDQWATAASSNSKRANHTATGLLDGRVLVVGGSTSSSSSADTGSCFFYDPVTNTSADAQSVSARSGHTASLLPDGRVIIAGGLLNGSVSSDTRIFKPSTNSWSNAIPMNQARRRHAQATMFGGLVLVAGGQIGTISLKSAEFYNPAANTWSSAGSSILDHLDFKATLLNDGRVLLAGGGHSSCELFTGGQGGGCLVAGDCLGGLTCVEGVCCNAPCGAANDSCTQSKTGKPNGTCAPVANGVSCNAGGECGSGFCAGGVCCDKVCDQASEACLANETGLLDGTCSSRKNGVSCSGNANCGSGFCVDDVCCESLCNTPCMSCRSADTGVPSGTCAPIKDGTDPADECKQNGSGSCILPGVCNGSGACRTKQGEVCGASACIGSSYTPPSTCNQAGDCQTYAPVPCPGNFTCADATVCRTSCTINAHCANDKNCLSDNTCGAGKGNGASCASNQECSSTYCVDGICCNSACNEGCTSCKISETGKTTGECNPVKDGTDPGNDCNPSGDADCGPDGLCDGQGACRGNKSQGGPCGASPVCSGLGVLANVCDGKGQCAAVQSLPCPGGYACSNGVCISSCSGDGDCAPSSYCSKGACVPRLKQGEPCQAENECGSGFCVEGVCCDSACTGDCASCLAKYTASGVDGKCESVLAGTDPRQKCDPDSGNLCGADGQCDGQGSCRQVAPKGSDCGGSTKCQGTASISGLLCDGGGNCAPVDSTPCSDGFICSNDKCLTVCGQDSDCTVGHFCNAGACADLLPNGAGCTKGSQCASTFCVDGVCCDSACEGKCMTCLAKASNGADGQCAPAVDGQDPRSDCDPTPGSPCLMDGQCDGKGACRGYTPKGTVCGGFTCLGADQIAQQECDGVGTCAKVNVSPCGGYACKSDVCLSSCGQDSDCTQGLVCKNGECVGKLNNGEACKSESQCDSGFCVDGVCCDSACTGDCQSCKAASNVAKKDGACGDVQEGLDPRQKCASDPKDACLAPGHCGKGGECAKFAQADTQCGSDSCVGESVVLKRCDGFGVCKDKTKQACSPYACDAGQGACKAKCLTNSDCAAGAECNSAKQECAISGATCADKFTVQSSTGQKTSCEPYSCLNGACKPSCDGNAECSNGFSCSGGKCVTSPGGAGAGGSGGSGSGGSKPGAGGSAGQPAGGGAGGVPAAGGQGAQPAPAAAEEDGGCAFASRPAPAPGSVALSLWALAALAVARRKSR